MLIVVDIVNVNNINVFQLHFDQTKKLLDMGLLDDAHPAQIYLEEYEVMMTIWLLTKLVVNVNG